MKKGIPIAIWFPDIARTPVWQVIDIRKARMFVQNAQGMRGLGLLHTDYKSTWKKVAAFGLSY
jgi:hypothetical protein